MGSGSRDMRKCFGRLTGILGMLVVAVAGMSVCDARATVYAMNTLVYAADMTTNAIDVTVCAADTSVYATDTSVYATDTSVYATDTSVYAIDMSVYVTDMSVYVTDMSVYATDTSAYAIDTLVYASDTSVYATDMLVNAAEMLVNVMDTIVNMTDTSVYATDTSVYTTDMAMNVTDTSVRVNDIKENTVFQVSTDVELHEAPDTTSAVTAALSGGTPVIVKEDAADGWCRVAYREQTGYVQVSFLSIVGSPVGSAAADGQTTISENETTQKDEAQKDKTSANGQQSGKPVQDNQAAQDADVQSDNITASDSGARAGNTLTANTGTDALDDEFRMIQEQNLQSYQEALDTREQARSDRVWGIVIAALVAAIFAVGIVTTLKGNRRNQS